MSLLTVFIFTQPPFKPKLTTKLALLNNAAFAAHTRRCLTQNINVMCDLYYLKRSVLSSFMTSLCFYISVVACDMLLLVCYNEIVEFCCLLFLLLCQRLCDYVCDLLLEESNVQPVSTPVTVCGDIHGQV